MHGCARSIAQRLSFRVDCQDGAGLEDKLIRRNAGSGLSANFEVARSDSLGYASHTKFRTGSEAIIHVKTGGIAVRTRAIAKLALISLLPMAMSAPAIAAPVRYELRNVVTAVGQYPTGAYGSGSLLGYFVYDSMGGVGVSEYNITAVADNSVQFAWSSSPAFPHPTSAVSYLDTSTGVWDLIFRTSLGSWHGVILELALRPADFDFTTATIPLIPATTNLPQTSNWYELIDSEYAAYGNVRSGSLAVVSEPTTLPLAALGLVAALGLTWPDQAACQKAHRNDFRCIGNLTGQSMHLGISQGGPAP